MGKATMDARLTEEAPATVSRRQPCGPAPSPDYTDLPRLPPAPPSPQSPHAKRRSPVLPPKLGIKKRKPRATSVVSAANQRVRAAGPPPPYSRSASSPPRKALRPPPRAASPVRRPDTRPARYKHPAADSDAKRKGLRHFAVRVSRTVEQKVVTTYNEVADELVAEETLLKKNELASGGVGAVSLQKKLEKNGTLVDEKNIRRRVYDSLNVLMAMGIIEKEKKLISWQGLAMAQSARGNGEITTMKAAIAEKRRVLEEKKRLMLGIQDQYTRTAAVVERNKEDATIPGVTQDILAESDNLLPVHHYHADRLGLPFIIISAPKDTSIELEMDKSREDICFTFNSTFQIFDEREVMRRMDLPLKQPLSPNNHINELEHLSNLLITSPAPSHRQ